MSYDLYFYKKKTSNLTEKDEIDYLNNTIYLTLFTISLDLIEESIQTFKKEIPWNFIDY